MWDQRFARCVPDARASCIAGESSACVTAGDHYAQSGKSADLTQARAYYRRACERAAAAGCSALGRLELSAGGPERRRRAEPWFARACGGGHLPGCTALAESYLVSGDAEQRAKVLELLKRACDGQEQRACARLVLLPDAVGEPQSCELARVAADRGDALGTLAWGTLAAAKRCSFDASRAYAAFETACTAGEGDACFELAQHQRGERAPRQEAERVRGWLDSACKQDNAQACIVLADDFEQGQSGPQDPALLRGALEAACALRAAAACSRLATLLDKSKPPAPTAARTAWEAACELSPSACYGLAEHLLDYPQTDADGAKAEALLRADCDRLHAEGCAHLADLRGWRAARSESAIAASEFASVQTLLETACELGDADSCANAALMLLNTDPNAALRARAMLERGCIKGAGPGCAYLERGPYPFPYPARGAAPARYTSRSRPSAPERPSASPPTAASELPAPAVVPAPRVQSQPADARHAIRAASFSAEFGLAATRMAKLGSMVWTGRARFGSGFGLAARVPMYGAVLRTQAGSQNTFGWGNPMLSATLAVERAAIHDAFELGVTLPFAYVANAVAHGDTAPRPIGQSGLEAAADSLGLEDAYLWTHNVAGLVASAERVWDFETWLASVDATFAALAPMYARDNLETFGALRGRLGYRVDGDWSLTFGGAVRGQGDAELVRFSLEPRVAYAAASGGRFELGLSIVVLREGGSRFGDSPWLGLSLRVDP